MDWLGNYEEEEEGGKGVVARKLASYTAPKDLVIPTEAEGDGEGEEHEDLLGGSRRIIDRESEYHKRRLNRQLSPPRVDPFAAAAARGSGAAKLRTYGDAVKEANLERERFNKLRERQEEERRREEGGEEREGTGEAKGSEGTGVPSQEELYRRSQGGVRREGWSGGRGRRERERSPVGHRARGGGERGGSDKGKREYTWGKQEDQEEPGAAKVEEPAANFGLSGLLAEETLTVKGVKLKYTEPAEARVPDKMWRLYVFKNGKALEGEAGVMHVHRQSMYLCGRERKVVDLPTDHPSCSGQHAVLQFREIEKDDPVTGFPRKHVYPYLMDLGSTNGSFINTEKLEPQRYYQLLEGDTVKFGSSSREYVLLHDQSGAA
ncbi:FHA domain-containing protein [Chloropicon primus]|uniref:FHA domain-containing protein n=2 Tax=Chloropicon primus TaxID=1764295 RepID=A0A5B8MXA5_9CHLO|nr:FHA domain-containing protein [Chloropicon primus]UPR03363.1 FHA domain-containing protein [Chloropicon primus]|eukprot:QDZ24154.1 FHA domain-containing protein [Chloropicon primus]